MEMDRLERELSTLQAGPPLLALLQSQGPASANLAQAVLALLDELKPPIVVERLDTTGSLAAIDNLSFIQPRGKFRAHFLPDRLVLQGPKQDTCLLYADMSHIAVLDNLPKDTKNRILLFIQLQENKYASWGKQQLGSILLSTLLGDELTMQVKDEAGGEPSTFAGPQAIVLCQLLGSRHLDQSIFIAPDTDIFSTTKGHCAVECYHKVNQGLLYLLPTALCFIERPALFVLHDDIRRLALQRANNVSSTFDIVIELRNGTIYEFTQIGREYQGQVLSYIQERRIRVGDIGETSDEEEEEDGEEGEEEDGRPRRRQAVRGEMVDEEGEDSDDESDEDYDPTKSDSEDEGGRKKKRRRGDGEGGEGEGGDEKREDDEEEGEEEEEESEDDESEDDDGDFELVDDEGIKVAQLKSASHKEKEEEKATKKKRHAAKSPSKQL